MSAGAIEDLTQLLRNIPRKDHGGGSVRINKSSVEENINLVIIGFNIA